MPADAEKPNPLQMSLQLLLFVDDRPSSHEQVPQLHKYLEKLKTEHSFELEVVHVGEQPYLAEHFKLVATPALIKIYPPPQQTIAGSNLISQLSDWWPRWKQAIEDFQPMEVESWATASDRDSIRSFAHVAELIRLSEQIFQLKQEKEELQQQLQFKERIIAMLAHDLRNPLTAASIALETLEINYNSGSNKNFHFTPKLAAKLIKQGRHQIRVIERLITDILQGAQGNNSSIKILPEKLDIKQLCQEVIDCLKNRFEHKLQDIKTDIPSDLPYVYADAERIRQVLVNLLDNANKYTPEGGLIQVSILHRTAQKVHLSVCDNGPGIPEENLDLIFEEHFRLTRDEHKEGYGIGLSLCRRIVRAHYGRIWVDSCAGQGSCFQFTLPVYR